MLRSLLRAIARHFADDPGRIVLTTVVVAEGQDFHPLPLFEGRVRMVRSGSDAALEALNQLGDRYDVAYSQ